MTRAIALNALKSGINRQRIKGGADPETLYDLLDGYVTISGTMESRPGTVQDAVLPAGTKGLVSFEGKLTVFSHEAKVIADPDYVCEVIKHPTDGTLALKEIHFAAPFLGYLYVAVEFTNGDVYHYWLQSGMGEWAANTVYSIGDLVSPETPNGYFYRATRLNAAQKPWEPNVLRVLNEKVEPTTPGRFEYTAVAVIGPAPKSGTTEPEWPEEEGAQVFEDTGIVTPPPPAPVDPPPPSPPPIVRERYRNPGGSYPPSQRQ